MAENSYKVNIVRLYADPAGESHFADEALHTTEVDFAPPAPPVYVSTPLETRRFIFLRIPEGWYGDMHPAPNRQMMVMVRGGLEVTVSNGEVRHFKTGDAVLVEDTFGKGHATRNMERETIVAVTQF